MVGHNGILPADQFIPALSQQADQQSLGLDRYRLEPTLCWFDTSDGFLQLQCAAGAALSVLVMAGISPAPCLFLLWLLYLSLATVGRTFLGFQWDNLLLEAGFLAIFFAPTRLLPSLARERPPSTTILWLIRWLLFRLMFASGCVKLLSGDKTWRDLTALNFHYETQPLPTWPAWFVHQLPEWFQKTSVVLMFGIELVVPFFIFLPRRLRLFGCWAMILFQVIIAVTGNYTFFNWLTIVLCVVLLDDAALFKCVPRRWREAFSSRLGAAAQVASPSGPWLILRRGGVAALAAVVLALTTFQTAGMFQRRLTGHSALVKFYGWIMPLRSFNNYGLFAVMTTTRLEIILEGSNDGQTWLAYEFNDKPGDLKRRPRFIAPHQPRLDWQMWFAALGTYRENPWFINFGVRLLQGSPEVLALLKHNPFPNAPPKHIRAVVYQYHFTDIDARRTEGTCWRREFKGEYCPVLTLR